MAYKPGDFFVSVFDLFAILLPGAMLAYISSNFVRAEALGLPRIERGSAEGWVAFVFASFVMGYFVSVVGALTDELYDPIAKKRKWSQSRVKEFAEKLLSKRYDGLRAGDEDVKGGDEDLKIEEKISERLIKASVTLQSPAAAAELERLSAISKFFRSFAVVVLVFGISLATYLRAQVFTTAASKVAGVLAFFIVLGTSLGLYAFHRKRRNEYIYVYFIVGERLASEGVAAEPGKKGGGS